MRCKMCGVFSTAKWGLDGEASATFSLRRPVKGLPICATDNCLHDTNRTSGRQFIGTVVRTKEALRGPDCTAVSDLLSRLRVQQAGREAGAHHTCLPSAGKYAASRGEGGGGGLAW